MGSHDGKNNWKASKRKQRIRIPTPWGGEGTSLNSTSYGSGC
jgi:hypothetical protein